jgi:prolyl oligopeptidase
MKKTISSTILLFCIMVMNAQPKKDRTFTLKYPETKKILHKDFYFGNEVIDNYNWLEDDRSKETEDWVKKQNELTYNYLSKIPYRNQIKNRLEKLWNYEKISAPFTEGKFTYYFKNNGLQNQSVLYRKSDSGKEDEVFLDPNTFSSDGTTSLGQVSFSKDGSKVAYSISEGGSDWRKVFVMDAITKKIIEEPIVDVKFSGLSWFKNEGFYYSSYEKPKGSELSAKTDQHKLYYHKLGTTQKDDQLVYGQDRVIRYVGGWVTEDYQYLFITLANSTNGNELYFKDLTDKKSELITITTGFDHDFYYIENVGSKFYIQTNYNAPNGKVIIVDAKNPSKENWKDLIPETENVLEASTGNNYLFANYMKDAISYIKQYDFDGKFIRDIALPGLGNSSNIGGKKSDKILYYSFTNHTSPSIKYALEPFSGVSTLYQKPKIDFNSDNFESKQVFYTSKDGTKIPMMITYKKGLKLDGKNPTILYGYGGFNISITPSFSIVNLIWMENGGIYAEANLRGGGEYGKKWHDAGIKMNKQNVFDDFIAASEYLIAQKYTSSDFLAIKGVSNGGLLVGAAMTQRPDLFKVALPAVGVMDMLKYHTFTAGAGWAYDFGTVNDSLEMFNYLKGYSPVHNVKQGVKYPATLITTGDHDDRVVPAHSFKFAAQLQEKQSGENPTLIRINVNAGHGAGKSVSASIQEHSDILSFTFYNMGIKELNMVK